MTADRHIVANVVVTVRCFHVDIARKAAVRFPRGRIGFDEVGHANAAPMGDLTPPLDTLEFRDKLVRWQSGSVCHREQQPGCVGGYGGIAWPSFFESAGPLSGTLSNGIAAIHHRFRRYKSEVTSFGALSPA